jgi:c-di-AMP phosphodiesterase-like protein
MGKLKNRHYSRVDWLTYALVIIVVTATILSIIISPENIWINLIYLAILIFVFYSWFTTYFKLENKTLLIYEGKSKIEIFYREIVNIEITTNSDRKQVHGFSKKCIKIQYGKHGRETTYISPFKTEAFYEKLKEKCKNLKEDK